MLTSKANVCQRSHCQQEANRIGHCGIGLPSKMTGVDEKTIRRGQQELAADLTSRSTDRVRQPGGKHPSAEKDPLTKPALQEMVTKETAGDPASIR